MHFPREAMETEKHLESDLSLFLCFGHNFSLQLLLVDKQEGNTASVTDGPHLQDRRLYLALRTRKAEKCWTQGTNMAIHFAIGGR